MKATFRIFRFDPEVDADPRYQTYQVEAEPHERVLDGLNRIRWEQDPSLAYRMSCGHGVCGSDAMRINGRCALACQKLLKACEGEEIVLEPLPSFKVQRDLMVDLSPFFEKVNFIRPYLMALAPPPREGERLQSPGDRKPLDEVIRCILCACCAGACPVSNEKEVYLGPAPLVWAFRYVFDTRDGAARQRLELLDTPEGVWGCENHFECTRVCPKEIPVTRSINRLKREIEKVFGKERGEA